MLASPVVEVVCGAIGLFLLGVVVWSGLSGVQTAAANFAPTFVYVIFWLGPGGAERAVRRRLPRLQPVARRGPGGVVGGAEGGRRVAARHRSPIPTRLGRWPAALGILLFAVLELVAADGDLPENVAIAALVYSAFTWIAMALYGVEAWIERGEAFARLLQPLLAPLRLRAPRAARWACAAPLSGLAALRSAARHRAAAGGDDRLGVLRRLLRVGAVEQRVAGHRRASSRTSAWPPERALEATFLVGLIGGGPRDLRALPPGHARRSQRGRRPLGAASWPTASCTRWCRSRSPTWPPTT